MEEKFIKLCSVSNCITLCEYQSVIISRDIRYLCLHLLNNQAILYCLSRHNEYTEGPVWQNPNVHSCIFSDDGNELIITSSDNCCKIYRLLETSIVLLQEITREELSLILGEFDIELTCDSSVKLLKCNKKTVILFVNNKWLIILKWSGEKVLLAQNKIEVASCIKISVGHSAIYALTAGGNVSAYDQNYGVQLGVVHLYAMVPPSRAMDVLGFKHLSVNIDGSSLAVSDRASQIFLVKLKNEFLSYDSDANERDKWNCGTSVMSFDSDVSQVTTASRIQPKILADSVSLSPSVIQESTTSKQSYKITWNSYLQSLNKSPKGGSPGDQFSCMQRMPDPPPGLMVRALQLGNAELSIWYTEPDAQSGGVYYLHDLSSGSYIEQCVPDDTIIIPGGLIGLKDAFLSPRGLYMFLGNLAHDVLVSKMLHCMQRESLGRILQGETWSTLMVPLSAVVAALRQQQLDVVQLALNLHVHGLKSTFANIADCDEVSRKDKLRKLVTDLEELLQVIQETCSEYSKKPAFREQLIATTLEQTNRVLEFLHKSQDDIAQELIQKIMQHVVHLRKYLLRQSASKDLKKQETENMLHQNQLSAEWQKWVNMSDEAVIQDAIMKNCIPLSQVFFIQIRTWPPDSVNSRYHNYVDIWVSSLLKELNIEMAEMILWRSGKDPEETLLNICMKTEEQKLRDVLAQYLLEKGLFPSTEMDALNFMKQIEEILDVVDFSRLGVRNDAKVLMNIHTDEDKISLSTVLKQSNEWRQYVLISLLFNVPGAGHLEASLQPEYVWLYLLENNREDLLFTWITCHFSECPLESTPLCIEKWAEKLKAIPIVVDAEKCNYISSADLLNIFTRWSITENMVNAVLSANAISTLKELVLNHLSRFGVFSSHEKTDAIAILKRIIFTGNVNNLDNVFSQKHANVSYTDFKLLFTRHLISNNLYEISFPCLEDFDYSEEELKFLYDSKESNNDWFPFWLAFREMKKKPDDYAAIYKAILKNAEYLSKGNLNEYLKEHPLVVLALLIFEGRSLAEVFTSGEEITNLDKDVLSAVLTHYPMFERAVISFTTPREETPDITLYQLLEENIPFDISKLFGWQECHRIEGEEFPHFTSSKLVEKYGIEYKMSYLIYLKLARPCFAACRFVVDQYKTYATLSQKRIKDAINVAHGLALQYFEDSEITASCLAFTEILGEDSSKLKVDLDSVTKVFNFMQNSEEEEDFLETFGEMVYELHQRNSKASTNLLLILERALVKEMCHKGKSGKETMDDIAHWGLAVKFARFHGLKLPEVYLRQLTAENNLFLFIVFIEIYSYPLHQVKELSASFKSLALQEHLFHILQVRVESEKQEKQHITPRDIRKTLYSNVLFKKPKSRQEEPFSSGKPKKLAKRRRESEQSDQQKGATNKMMGLAASLSSGSSGEEAAGSNLISYDVWGVDEKKDLFLVLLKCHNAEYPLQALLEATYSLQNPVLSVLATCYDLSMVVPCFCAWLIVSLPTSNSEKLLNELNKSICDLDWCGEEVLQIMREAVSCKFIRTLQQGCWIFFPDNPLCDLMDFLYEAIVMKDFEECLLKMKSFKAAYLNLKNNDKNKTTDFFSENLWLGRVAVELCKVTVTSALTSLQYVLEFLAILRDGYFLEHLPEPVPDFELVEHLVKSLCLTGVFPNMEALISSADSSTHKNEVKRCLEELLQSKQFSSALELAAAGNLNKDPILMAQWSDKFEQSSKRSLGRDFMGFWKKCDEAFRSENVHPQIAAKFHVEHAGKLNDMEEKFRVLQLAVGWLQKAVLTATACIVIKVLEYELASVELNMWNCWLQAPSELPINIENTEVEMLNTTKTKILEIAGISKLTKATEIHTEEEKNKIHTLVGKLLDMGNLVSACRVEAMYNIKNQDLHILLLCLGLAEGTLSPYELTAEQRLLFSETSSVRSLSHRRRALLSSISALSHSPGTNSLLVDYVEIPPRDRQDTLTSLEKLTGRLQHGVGVGNRIVMCYRVAMNLDLNYLNVLLMSEPLNLLKTALADDCLNKFIVASDIITAAQINNAEVADFMANEILEAVTKSKLKGEISGTIMWGIELESCFHLVLDICKDQAALGDKLLGLAAKAVSSRVHGFYEAHVIAVELVIHAHNCFVAALSMEGISSVLQISQTITTKLLKKEEWALMVRLLTGVERYTEMNYIFKILYENEQFEYLLAKGLDKVKGLKVALIDFLKKRPGDRKLYEMVTLRFNMFEEVAMLWENDGLQEQDAVLKFVLKDSNSDSVLCLPNTDIVRKHLINSMDCFKHSAEFFIKGELLIKAMHLVHHAELIALQQYYLSTVPSGQNAPLLLGLNVERVAHLVTHYLVFPHAYLVVRAYDHPVDWAAVLYQHCVLDGDDVYFNAFTSSISLNSSLIEDIVRRFQVNTNITADNARMMKKFIEQVESLELKYRLASQLGFRDLIESLLNGPEDDVAYLKDTVWQHGFRS